MPKVQFTGQLQRFMAVPKAEAGGATVRDPLSAAIHVALALGHFGVKLWMEQTA